MHGHPVPLLLQLLPECTEEERLEILRRVMHRGRVALNVSAKLAADCTGHVTPLRPTRQTASTYVRTYPHTCTCPHTKTHMHIDHMHVDHMHIDHMHRACRE